MAPEKSLNKIQSHTIPGWEPHRSSLGVGVKNGLLIAAVAIVAAGLGSSPPFLVFKA